MPYTPRTPRPARVARRSGLRRFRDASSVLTLSLARFGGRVFGNDLPRLGRVLPGPRYALHGVVAGIGLVVVVAVAWLPSQQHPLPATPASSGVEAAAPGSPGFEAILEPATAAPAAEPAPVVSVNMDEEPAAPEPTAEPEPEPVEPVIHQVAEGESIRMLAARYGVSIPTILVANGLSNPDLLAVGQELMILPTTGVLHTIGAGDTLRRVAEVYEVGVQDIIEVNSLGQNPDLLAVGTRLIIPVPDPLAFAPRRSDADGDQQAAAIGVSPVGVEQVTRRRAPSPRSYEVQPGDSLRSIAETFGVNVATVLSSNGIQDPDLIVPGVELRILPVAGIEYEVEPGESLAEIAWKYQVDLGLLLDYNDLDNPDMIRVGDSLVLPGGQLRPEAVAAPAASTSSGGAVAPAAPVRTGPAAEQPAPAAQPAPQPAARPAAPAPAPSTSAGSGGANVVANAMKFLGYPYVFGGTSPSGFDCSGFVYYIHQVSGSPVGRGMWQQFNGGARISRDALVPGDTVFFANTYMPGLSHNGIYVGNGQFVHASDPSVGVVVSSMNSSYWASRYVGAARLYN